MKKRSFEELFLKHGTMYIGDAIPTPKLKNPPPPPPRTTKEQLTTIPDIDYESPIKVYQNEMKTKMDNDIFEIVQSYSISVDKAELVKALKYDRQQYEKGFKDGVRKFVEKWKEFSHSREVIWDTGEVMDILAEELVGEYIAE